MNKLKGSTRLYKNQNIIREIKLKLKLLIKLNKLFLESINKLIEKVTNINGRKFNGFSSLVNNSSSILLFVILTNFLILLTIILEKNL